TACRSLPTASNAASRSRTWKARRAFPAIVVVLSSQTQTVQAAKKERNSEVAPFGVRRFSAVFFLSAFPAPPAPRKETKEKESAALQNVPAFLVSFSILTRPCVFTRRRPLAARLRWTRNPWVSGGSGQGCGFGVSNEGNSDWRTPILSGASSRRTAVSATASARGQAQADGL